MFHYNNLNYIYLNIHIYIYIYIIIYGTDVNINAVTWQTVHERKVAGAFRSKKGPSSQLIHEQKA